MSISTRWILSAWVAVQSAFRAVTNGVVACHFNIDVFGSLLLGPLLRASVVQVASASSPPTCHL